MSSLIFATAGDGVPINNIVAVTDYPAGVRQNHGHVVLGEEYVCYISVTIYRPRNAKSFNQILTRETANTR